VDLGDPTSYFAFALSFDFVCFGFFGVFAFLSIQSSSEMRLDRGDSLIIRHREASPGRHQQESGPDARSAMSRREARDRHASASNFVSSAGSIGSSRTRIAG
jgi:hypothetical protein